ncbi:hypothetical protein [Streptomyces mangrovisoli]|uniref:Gram-positive cocci surface proteins LPxTG domain-containing protein n=1 Tax=Streptomyces mangrovisoli TaxID=1428628 RepID=A0A1J4NZE8_9ACTN|nr:hypothetical protein [Streptomyces mangrovisoli]OIJ67863.1 hypothetical protein WN71_010970 [Streptomyces mangrovisoli]
MRPIVRALSVAVLAGTVLGGAVPTAVADPDAEVGPGTVQPGGTLTVTVSCDPVGGAAPDSVDATSEAFDPGTVRLKRVPADDDDVAGPSYRGTARITAGDGTDPSGADAAWTVQGTCPAAPGAQGQPWNANFSVGRGGSATGATDGAATGAADGTADSTADGTVDSTALGPADSGAACGTVPGEVCPDDDPGGTGGGRTGCGARGPEGIGADDDDTSRDPAASAADSGAAIEDSVLGDSAATGDDPLGDDPLGDGAATDAATLGDPTRGQDGTDPNAAADLGTTDQGGTGAGRGTGDPDGTTAPNGREPGTGGRTTAPSGDCASLAPVAPVEPDDPVASVQRGVDAGTGGSLDGSVPAVAAGSLLVLGAAGGAVYRMRRRRGAARG